MKASLPMYVLVVLALEMPLIKKHVSLLNNELVIPSKLLNKLLQLQGLPHDGILINGHLKPILIPATRLQQSIRRNIAVLLQMSVGLQPLNEQLMLGIKENSSNYYGTS